MSSRLNKQPKILYIRSSREVDSKCSQVLKMVDADDGLNKNRWGSKSGKGRAKISQFESNFPENSSLMLKGFTGDETKFVLS